MRKRSERSAGRQTQIRLGQLAPAGRPCALNMNDDLLRPEGPLAD